MFPTQGLNLGLLHCGQILYQLSHKGSSRLLDYPFFSGSSDPGIKPGSPALQADSLPTVLSGKSWITFSSKRKWNLLFVKHQVNQMIYNWIPLIDYESEVLESLTNLFKVLLSCPTLCDPMDHSTSGLPVHHQLPEHTQIHVHWVSDAIQPSHPLSSPSPSTFNPSHQGLFQWVNSSHQVVKVLELQL